MLKKISGLLVLILICIVGIFVTNINAADKTDVQIFSHVKVDISDSLKDVTRFNVMEFGADGTDSDADADAIQEALNKAIDIDDSSEIVVNIPTGTYYLNKTLDIYSNTRLVLAEDAELIRMDESLLMATSKHLNSVGIPCTAEKACIHYGYTQGHNINN